MNTVSITTYSSPAQNIFSYPEAAPEEIVYVEIKEHPLVVSCMIHRIAKEKGSFPTDLQHALDGTNVVADEDRVLAEKIKAYYAGKIMFSMLAREVSKFRKDVLRLLNVKPADNKYDHKLLGIAFRLPTFYENDIILDNEIFSEESKFTPRKDAALFTEKKLTFITKINPRRTRTVPPMHYWFKDELDNRVLVIADARNSLLPLWEKVITESPVIIKGKLLEKSYDSKKFYTTPAMSWQFIRGSNEPTQS